MDLNIKLAEALVIKPGDRVLLLLRDYGWTKGHIEEARGFLEERFPDVTFGFMSHVEGAVVERESDQDAARDAEEPAEEQWSVWLKEPGGITVVTPLDCDDEQAWALEYLERLPPEKLATATLNRRTRGPWSHWAQVDQPRTPSGCDGEDSPEEQAPIDMGYMSLPVETQRAIELAAWSAAQDNPEERTDEAG